MEKFQLCQMLFVVAAVTIGPQRLLSAAPADVIPTDWKSYIHPDMLREYLKTRGGDKFDASSGLFEGDIVGSERGFSQVQLANFAKIDARTRWPGGIVPIAIHAAFRPEEAKTIKGATAAISRKSNGCVTFVDRTNEADYMEFQKDLSSCYSPIGRQGGRQIVSVSDDCLQNLGDIQHEVMHSLGFFHETSRLDRDQFVWINWDNIAKENQDQFQMYTNATTFGLPYDYESILHFPFTAFAIDSEKPTVIPKQKNMRIGQHKNLSPGDILKIKAAYKCDKQDVAPESAQPVADRPASAQPVTAQPKLGTSDYIVCRFYSNNTKSCQRQCLSVEESDKSFPVSRGQKGGQIRVEYINNQFTDPIFRQHCFDSSVSSHWDPDQGFFSWMTAFARVDQRRGLYVGSCVFNNDAAHSWNCRECQHYHDDVIDETSINCIVGGFDGYKPYYKQGWQRENSEFDPEAIIVSKEEKEGTGRRRRYSGYNNI